MKKVLLPAVLLMSPLLSYGRDHLFLSQQDNFSSSEQDSGEEDSSDLETSDQDLRDQDSTDQDLNNQESSKQNSDDQDSDDQDSDDQDSNDQKSSKQEPSKKKSIKHESKKKDSSKQDLNDDEDSDDEDSENENDKYSNDEYADDEDADDEYADDEYADDEDDEYADDEDDEYADDEDDEDADDEDAGDENSDDEDSADEDSSEEEEPLSLSGQRNLSLIIAHLNHTIDQNGTLTFGAGSLATFQAWINNLSGKLVFDATNTRIKCAPDSADCSKGLVIFTMPLKNGPICHVKTRSVFGSPRTMYYTGEVKAQFALDNGVVTFSPIDLNKTFPGQYGLEITFQSVTALGISMKVLTSQYTDSSGLVPQMPPENASATDKRQFDQKLWYSAASHETQYDRNAQRVIDSDKDLCGLAVFKPKT